MKINSCVCFISVLLLNSIISYPIKAQTAPPPALGQETKGAPAVDEAITNKKQADTDSKQQDSKLKSDSDRSITNTILGNATIKESRRESGQVYRIELEHSSGSKQVIEENDSDGQLHSDDNGLDDTPNLTKWKLGSW